MTRKNKPKRFCLNCQREITHDLALVLLCRTCRFANWRGRIGKTENEVKGNG